MITATWVNQDTNCAACGRELEYGDEAYYRDETAETYCIPCGTDIDDYINRRHP